MINAILWKLRTGAPWRDLPERYGFWKIAHERLAFGPRTGTWDRILDRVIVKDDAVGNVEWTFSIDSSSVRAHQHATGARKKGAAATEWIEDLAVDGEALGRSRGGLTSKLHLALADKAYFHTSTRAALRRRGIAFTSHERRDQTAHRAAKGSRGGRPPAIDPDLYASRNVVERCFNRLKQFPGSGHPLRQTRRQLPIGDAPWRRSVGTATDKIDSDEGVRRCPRTVSRPTTTPPSVLMTAIHAAHP